MIVFRRPGALAEEPPQVDSLSMFVPLRAAVRRRAWPLGHVQPRVSTFLWIFMTVVLVASILTPTVRQEKRGKHLPKHGQVTRPLHQRPRQHSLE